MASDGEAGPSNKHIKLDSAEPIMDVRDMNKLFLKIDNLEYFPLKVLMNIFAMVDDIGLYNLAETSTRFEKIARIVLNERYTHRYFIVDESKKEWERNIWDLNEPAPFGMYITFFERFGKEIKSIEIKNVYINQKYHEITRLLNKAINLKKLRLDHCRIDYAYFLQCAYEGITHLALHYVSGLLVKHDMPEYRNLKKLEIVGSPIISMDSMAEIFRNNPTLESLVLNEKRGAYSWISRAYPFGELMRIIGTHLNQLKELTYISHTEEGWNGPLPILQPDNIVDGFVHSLEHLESLTLSSTTDQHTDFFGLLRRLNSECTNIKHLKLFDVDGESNELFEVLRLFHRIESLTLRFIKFGDDADKTELFVSTLEHLQYLHNMNFIFDTNRCFDWFYITLSLLHRSRSLEKLTIDSNGEDSESEVFGSTMYHNRFIDLIQNQNTTLEFKVGGRVLGFVSKNEVFWRNKLMYWRGRDPDENSSSMKLLDLAMEPSNDDANAEQLNPIDLILDYLDLKSLYALSKANEKCSQIVMNYVSQHAQQQKTFELTDELDSHADYDGLETFAEYVTDLRVEMLHTLSDHVRILLKKLHNLTRLYFCSNNVNPHRVIVPQVRHLIYDGFCCNEYADLYAISCECPDLEKLKLIEGMQGDLRQQGERLKFRKLKKFSVKHNDHIHINLNDLKDIFKDTNTKLTLNI